jgi:hypothetical protein
MKVLFCNVRGLGGRNRRGHLKELISKHRVDVFVFRDYEEGFYFQ